MVENFIFERILNFGLKQAKGVLKEIDFDFDKTLTDVQESLNIHLRKCRKWSEGVSFKDAVEQKSLSDIYIHLNLEFIPARQRIGANEELKSIRLEDISFENNIVILGQPGAGKTTTLKYLTRSLLFDSESLKNLKDINYPILIKFRELDTSRGHKGYDIIIEELFKIFGFTVSKILDKKNENEKINKKELQKEIRSAKEKLVISFLQTQNILLILDGFDELPSIEFKEKIIKEIQLLSESQDNSKLIISSRSGDFHYHIQNSEELEIQPLSIHQITEFSKKWLKNDVEAKRFIKKIKLSPFFDTAIRPLTIAHLCAIYERIKDIPKKPKTVYRKVIDLMLEEWDQQRSINRSSNYANFEIDRKHEFLSAFAFELSEASSKNVFTEQEMITGYNHICDNFNLPRGEAKKVIRELETHSGLFLQSGHNSFSFAHKSLQEFLMAEYIVKLPFLPNEHIIEGFPNEMAISISISSSPGEYLSELIKKCPYLFDDRPSFYSVFTSRLMIEKPDFDYSLETGLTLLKLFEYSINKETGRISYKVGQDIQEFTEYLYSIIKDNKKVSNLVNHNYEVMDTKSNFYKYIKRVSSKGPRTIYYPKIK